MAKSVCEGTRLVYPTRRWRVTLRATLYHMNTIKHFARLARRPVRPASHLAIRCQRSFSFTPRVHARIKRPSELGSSLGSFEEVANLPAIRKLLSSPEAVKALDEIQQLMQEKGTTYIFGVISPLC